MRARPGEPDANRQASGDASIDPEDFSDDPEEKTDFEYDLSCSVRLVRPFLKVLPSSVVVPEVLAELEAMSLDHRLPLAVLNQMLEVAVSRSGDQDIGLKAARETSPGDAGVLDYAIGSASTVKDAIDTASRYIRLVNDGLEMRLEIAGTEAFDSLGEPRTAAACRAGLSGGRNLSRILTGLGIGSARESAGSVSANTSPQDTSRVRAHVRRHADRFRRAVLRIRLRCRMAERRLGSADARLHDVILKHAEKMLAELPRARQLTERVRSAIVDELAGGDPSVAHIAPRLRMSPRTLERKLEREGTTFSALLEELRKRLALRYVGSENLELAEIAFLLGFSQTTGFHRAFKRWTGATPLNYRAQQRAQRERPGKPPVRRRRS